MVTDHRSDRRDECDFPDQTRREFSGRINMLASLRTKWCILRTSIEERLVYRADFAFATLVRFLPIITQVFLWAAIYQATGPRDDKVINGYTYGDMVAYSLLVMVGRAFSSMPGLTTGIACDVRE